MIPFILSSVKRNLAENISAESVRVYVTIAAVMSFVYSMIYKVLM